MKGKSGARADDFGTEIDPQGADHADGGAKVRAYLWRLPVARRYVSSHLAATAVGP